MAIKITCESCESVFNVNETLAWKKAKCPKCQNILLIPSIEKPAQESFSKVEGQMKGKDFSWLDLGNIGKHEVKDSLENKKTEVSSSKKQISSKERKWKNRTWTIFLFFSLFMFILMWIGWYWYYQLETNPEDNFIVNNDIYKAYFSNDTSIVKIFPKPKEVNNINKTKVSTVVEDINYQFSLKTNFESKENNTIIGKWYFNIDNGVLISNEWGLKQKLSAEKVSSQYNFSNISGQLVFDNADFISDNEILYFLIWKWYERIFNDENIYSLLKNTKLTKNTISSIKENFSDEKYVKIDNWKTIANVFWEISKTTILKNIITWFVTSNPKVYFFKNWIDKKVQNILIRDRFLDYLFKSTSNEDINLKVNSKICEDITPILVKTWKELMNLYGIEYNNISRLCDKNIWYINELLSFFDSIYKWWNTEKWDFKLIFTKNEEKVIIINYKNHIIDSWKINFRGDNININSEWDSYWVKSSNLEINLESWWVRISWEINEWNWRLEITLQEEKMKIISNINLEHYKLIGYNFGYEVNSDDFSTVKVSSEYKEGVFNFNYLYNWGEVENSNKNLSINYSYDGGNIKWEIKNNLFNYILSWNYNKINDFNLLLFDEELWIELTFITNKVGEEKLDYLLSFKLKWKPYLSWLINILKTKEDDSTLLDIEWNMKYNNIKYFDLFWSWRLLNEKKLESRLINWEDEHTLEKGSNIVEDNNEGKVAEELVEEGISEENINKYINELKFSSNLVYKIWEWTYNIPEDFKEIKIKAAEIFILPNLWSIINLNKNDIFLYWAIWIWWYVWFEWFKWYWKKSDNTKRDSDIDNIISIINLKKAEWVSLSSMVDLLEEYNWKNIIIWWKKLVFWQNYFVGTFNHKILWVEKDYFQTPNWDYYVLWITTRNWWKYQVLSTSDKWDWELIYKISWDYIPSEFKILRKGKDYNTIEDTKWEFKSITLLGNLNVNLILKWDIIWWKKVLKVSNDKKIITFDKEVKSNSILLKAGSKSLISINWKIIVNWSIVE